MRSLTRRILSQRGLCLSALLVAARSVALAPAAPEPADVDGMVLVAPTQGRPTFVAPGGILPVTIQFDPAGGVPRFELSAPDFPVHDHLLSGDLARGTPESGACYHLRVPADVPEQTYDIVVRNDAARVTGPHAVAVRKPEQRVRLVHLSNMNVGEAGVPDFDWALVDEINLLQPTLIVTSGDYIDATHDDPDAAWQELARYFAAFDAPVLAACGDHDDLEQYSRYLAPSPIGAIEVGPYRAFVLYDLPKQPVVHDADQIAWLERDLPGRRHEMAFVVSHDQSPNLLAHWQAAGTLNGMIRAGRLGLWFAGGHRDWDGREYLELVTAARPMLYLRTHQASPATRGGATGTSHYRVVDLDGDRAVLTPPLAQDGTAASLPAGHLRLVLDGPNDGSRERVELHATSTLPFRVKHAGTRVWVRRDGDQRPWVRGARLASLVELPGIWECRLAFDLPERGGVHAVVGTGPPPPEPQVQVQFLVADELILVPRISDDGVSYLHGGAQLGFVQLQNAGGATAEVTPIIRLDGETLAYRVPETQGPLATAYALRLAPQQVLTLMPDLSAVRIEPGEHELQVYLKGGVGCAPVCTPVKVSVVANRTARSATREQAR